MIDLGDLNERLGYFVRRLQIWIFQDFIRRLARIDISPAQFSVLVVIGANPDCRKPKSPPRSASSGRGWCACCTALERRGLTQRLPSSADGRRHALRLTRDGQKLLAQAKALAAQHEAALKEKLGGERHKALLEVLREF